MQVINIIAYKRDSLHKAETRKLRKSGQVPVVVYGNKEVLHAAVPAILFRSILRSKEALFIHLNIEGREIDCILQDVQYHPVAGHIIHADFLILTKKIIKMNIPLRLLGNSPGLSQGGKLQFKLRMLHIKALPQHMPSQIDVDISTLELGALIKVRDLPKGNYEILDNPVLPVIGVQVPKVMRSAEVETLAKTTEVTEESTENPA